MVSRLRVLSTVLKFSSCMISCRPWVISLKPRCSEMFCRYISCQTHNLHHFSSHLSFNTINISLPAAWWKSALCPMKDEIHRCLVLQATSPWETAPQDYVFQTSGSSRAVLTTVPTTTENLEEESSSTSAAGTSTSHRSHLW